MMIRTMMLLALGLFLVAASVQAQETKSTSRVERQHKYTHFQKGQMKQSEASLLAAIESPSAGLQQTAIQSMRDLEQMDTAYPFSSLIGPLSEKLKNEQADKVVRMLAALALDELHSDAGDAAIRSVAENSTDTGLKTLCQALQVRSNIK